MQSEVPRVRLAEADQRSSADRLRDLRACHRTLTEKRRLLMAAAYRNDLQAMRALQLEIGALEEIAAECVRRILEATQAPGL